MGGVYVPPYIQLFQSNIEVLGGVNSVYNYTSTGGLILGGTSISAMATPPAPVRVTKVDAELCSTIPHIILKPVRVTKVDAELYSTTAFPVIAPLRVTKVDAELYSTSVWATGFNYIGSGGLTLSGTSLNELKFNHIATGGLTLSGQNNAAFILSYKLYDSGLILSGTSIGKLGFKYAFDGGLILNKPSENHFYSQYFRNEHFGNQHFTSEYFENYSYEHAYAYASGGSLILAGDALVNYFTKYNYISEGGLILSGNALAQNGTSFSATGGLIFGGTSIAAMVAAFNYIGSGGLTLSGTSLNELKLNHIATGGLTLSGQNNAAFILSYKLYDSGLTLSGTSEAFTVTSAFSYIGSGGLVLSGQNNAAFILSYKLYDSGLILSGTSIGKLGFKYAFDGGLILASDALVNYGTKYNYISEGGLILAGDYQRSYYYESTGELTLGDSSTSGMALNTSFTGALILGGTALSENGTSFSATGGLILGGTPLLKNSANFSTTGGLILGGSSLSLNGSCYYESTGGLILGGSSLSLNGSYAYESTGGLILDGSSLSLNGSYAYESTGGLILDGTPLLKNSANFPTTGGLILGGTPLLKNSANFPTSGGLVLGGSSLSLNGSYVYVSTGGLTLSGHNIAAFELYYRSYASTMTLGGTALTSYKINYYNMLGGLTLGGTALVESAMNFSSSGGLTLGGTSLTETFATYVKSGGALINTYLSSQYGSSFIYSLDFSWNVIQSIELDLDFSWDIGNEGLYWYTVEGICKVSSGCKTTGVPQGSKGRIFSRTLAARNLTDLCFKLKTLYLNYPVDWPITKILRYKKPVYLDSINYVDDSNSYNLLENNDLVRTTIASVDTISNYELTNTIEYPDKFTLILPDSRKIVKNFDNGVLTSVDIIDVNGLTKNYRENTVATITAVPSSLMSINYKIEQQIKSLNLDDNSGVLQQYCHIPECLAFCVNEDLLIEIGCTTDFTDAFYDYVAEGGLILSGRSIIDDVNLINFNGGFTLSGSALYTKNSFKYIPSGNLTLGSSPLVVFTAWRYLPLNTSLVLSGSALTVAENLSYESAGYMTLSGSILFNSSYKFIIKNPILSLSGTANCNYEKTFNYFASGGLTLGSSFGYNSNRYKYFFNDGLYLSGNSLISADRRNYTFTSELTLSGSYLSGYKYSGSGSLILGDNFYYIPRNTVIAGGLLFLGSTAVVSSTNFNYVPEGRLILGGSFDTNIFNDLDLMVNIGSNIDLLTFEPILPELYDTDADSFTYENGFVTNYDCGCGSIPVKLYLNNNITTSGLLKTYLNRNNLSLSNDIELTYNVIGKSWRHNAYLNSVDNLDKWIIIYEWTCDVLDSVNVWNFSISVSRQLNGKKKNTNLILLFDKTDPCNNEKIDFNFNFNTNVKNIVSPNGLNVLKYIVKDDIGLFKDKDWLNTSLLKVKISESQNVNSVIKKDIFSIFPT